MTHKEYFKEAWQKQVEEWKSWRWYEWTAQIVWLAIVVAMFYYGVTLIIYAMQEASLAGVNPNGPLGLLISFSPLLFVFSLFAVHAAYRSIVNIIFAHL